MVNKLYFDLIKNDLNNLRIKKVDNFNCQLSDDQKIYNGFILSQSRMGSVYTVCDIDFQKSATDQKYQARLTFRKTDTEFKERNTIKGVDCVRIPFQTGDDGYREFWKMISFLYKWKGQIDLGEFDDYFAVTDKNVAGVLMKLADVSFGKIVVDNLEKISQVDLFNIANLVSVAKINKILQIWNNNKNNLVEEFWQNTFKDHSWVLSQIFSSPYVKIGEKFYCGGKEDDNKGGVLGDFQYKNSLTDNIAFIEIKTPADDILIGSKYRGEIGKENIIYSINEELTGGVNQVLNQKKVYLKTHGEKSDKKLNNTKCILVIGKLPLDTDKKQSFEYYRNSLKNVEIVTYDELFGRIEGILQFLRNN
jgi:hypothetical protein